MLKGIPDLDRHSSALHAHNLDRIQVLQHPVRSGRNDLLDRVARYQAHDFAPRGLACLDARRCILEHEKLLALVLHAQALAAEVVACRVGLALVDGLGGDEVLRDGEVEDVEPAGDEGLGAGGDDGPGGGEGD